MLRALGALALLLGILAGALWATRRFDLRLPGRVGHRAEQRLELVERLTIDQRRSAVLIRCDGREHLVIVAPEGHVMVSSEDMVVRSPEPPELQAPISVLHAPPARAAAQAGKRERPKRARWHLPQQNTARAAEKSEQLA